MTTEREQLEWMSDQSAAAWSSDLPKDDIAQRFDRIEQRLASLARMLGELLRRGHEGHAGTAQPSAPPHDVVAPPQQPPASDPVPDLGSPNGLADIPYEGDDELDASVREYVDQLLKRSRNHPPECPAESATPTAGPAPAKRFATAMVRDSQSLRVDDEIAADALSPRGLEVCSESDPTRPLPNLEQTPPQNPSADAPDIVLQPSAVTPLRLPPERETNLRALREVANLSATLAIRTYDKAEAARKTADRLPLLLIGLVGGLMLLYSAYLSGRPALFAGAAAAFVGAALTGSQMLVILCRWFAASRPVKDR